MILYVGVRYGVISKVTASNSSGQIKSLMHVYTHMCKRKTIIYTFLGFYHKIIPPKKYSDVASPKGNHLIQLYSQNKV